MKKMEMEMLKVHPVINKRILLLALFLLSYSLYSQDKDLVNTYIIDFLKKHDVDSITLGGDNSNYEIFKKYKRIVNNSPEEDSISPTYLAIEQSKNYERQITRKSLWDSTFVTDVQNLYKKNRNITLYISKPIYTNDGQYALISSYQKSKSEVYFIPPIEVYKYGDSIWEKINTIRESGFKKVIDKN